MKLGLYILMVGGIIFLGCFFFVKDKHQLKASISSENQQLKTDENQQFKTEIELNDKEARLFKLFLKEDIKSYVTGTESRFETGTYYAPIPIVTTADRLQDEYERNEVAGDQKYRSKELIVSGTIASIDRSLGENYFISLIGGSNTFIRPRAKMADGYVNFLASLQKKQDISLFCKGDGMLMGSAILVDCIPVEKWLDTTVEIVFRSWHKFVQAKEETISGLVIFSHIYGKSLSENSKCLENVERQECVEEFKKIMAKMNKNEFADASKRFGIDLDFPKQGNQS